MKIGLSSVGIIPDDIMFENCHKAGIDVMEISLTREGYAALDDQKTKALAEQNEIELWSMHLPFAPFEEIDPSVRKTSGQAVSYFSDLIRRGADMGIKRFIVHASGEPIEGAERMDRMRCAKESLRSLAELAGEYGAVIAVEDLPRTCLGRNSEEIKELISAHDELRVCFDTNHLLSEDPVRFVRELKDKIITTHVSDYDFADEKHWLPGEGKVDWGALYNSLVEIGYEGAWIYELGFKPPKTIQRKRDLTYSDFVRNAKEIFSGKEPSPII